MPLPHAVPVGCSACLGSFGFQGFDKMHAPAGFPESQHRMKSDTMTVRKLGIAGQLTESLRNRPLLNERKECATDTVPSNGWPNEPSLQIGDWSGDSTFHMIRSHRNLSETRQLAVDKGQRDYPGTVGNLYHLQAVAIRRTIGPEFQTQLAPLNPVARSSRPDFELHALLNALCERRSSDAPDLSSPSGRVFPILG